MAAVAEAAAEGAEEEEDTCSIYIVGLRTHI
jgi:hypothetical protein